MREINVQENLDLSNERNVQCFIEKHINFFDKPTSLNNRQILTSHLKHINTKILQKVETKRRNIENIKRVEVKVLNNNVSYKKKVKTNLRNKFCGLKKNLSPTLSREKHVNLQICKRRKCKSTAITENSDIFFYDTTKLKSCNSIIDSNAKLYNQKDSINHSLTKSVIDIAKKEIEMAEKILWFHTKDVEFIKKKLHVFLYIAKNENYVGNMNNRMKYNQLLCHHSILCLIEPSKKAFVSIEDDLMIVIKKHLSQGYKYQFEFQRGSQNCFTALLVLSQWASILVQHLNTTMIQTICGILRCDVHEILVLHSP
ncbi:uncharacterized protein LOC116424588 isoform X2 [Nomia melanderi]|nr:uncharacterized protein LOC116424588 isoform X2 [Nomia melanderi]XP_031827040.1 uncharacterized protein LOC116424588 isoform X2 [Nomia melanderi]XP_031827042.1 uncharacterized protein LOC116424588 isoform X2 [Nomia melanderi]XP_031827043.1 uncharacterized protein LOC116424588 isoform X2 [Nomia melanderi]XP_031827044.1 uncharacterized protein LOC116424588 isoform X2 [Nomia melanderi]